MLTRYGMKLGVSKLMSWDGGLGGVGTHLDFYREGGHYKLMSIQGEMSAMNCLTAPQHFIYWPCQCLVPRKFMTLVNLFTHMKKP